MSGEVKCEGGSERVGGFGLTAHGAGKKIEGERVRRAEDLKSRRLEKHKLRS